MSRTIQWCDGPTPSASRPPVSGMRRQRLARQAQSGAGPAAAPPRCPARCASWCARHQRDRGQRVEVVGDLRHPRGVQPGGLGPLDVVEQLGDLAGRCRPARRRSSLRRARFSRPTSVQVLGVLPSERADLAHEDIQRGAGRETPRRPRQSSSLGTSASGSCRRPRRRCRRRRRRAAPRWCGWSARDARRTGCSARRRRRLPAGRSTRCPRCAAGCRCRSPRSRRRATCGRRSWRRGRARPGRAWRRGSRAAIRTPPAAGIRPRPP